MPPAARSAEPRLSAWVERFLPLAPRCGARGLDVACGLGRHSLYASVLGFRVLALDRDPDFAARCFGIPEIEFRREDLEDPQWDPPAEQFAAILVVNYLHRPLFPALGRLLVPGGLLICETFTEAQGRVFGKPSNPLHWLSEGELPGLVRPLSVLAFEEGRTALGKHVQRICAVSAGQRSVQEMPLGAP